MVRASWSFPVGFGPRDRPSCFSMPRSSVNRTIGGRNVSTSRAEFRKGPPSASTGSDSTIPASRPTRQPFSRRIASVADRRVLSRSPRLEPSPTYAVASTTRKVSRFQVSGFRGRRIQRAARRVMASRSSSTSCVSVMRKYPSPCRPNPTPGVTTTPALSNTRRAKSMESFLAGTWAQT